VQLVLTEDQELLAKTVADFAAEHSPVSRVRALRDANDADGFSRELWRQMAELGWVGIPFPEEFGGADMGLAGLAVVLEALGRKLAPEPFLSSVLLGGQALLLGGSERQKSEWLPKLVEGERLLTVAYQERRSRYDLRCVATRAERNGSGWCLRGEKIQVLDGSAADGIVVVARTSGGERDADGITLFAVRPDASGLRVERQHRVDSRNAAVVTLGRRPARARRGPGHGGAVCGDARLDVRGLRAHARLSQAARAVRGADRKLPGPQAPSGSAVHRDRAVPLGGDGGRSWRR
jgi:alkylation response protein AidB-like acyl-CoA dehydrogenase